MSGFVVFQYLLRPVLTASIHGQREESVKMTEDRDKWRKYVIGWEECSLVLAWFTYQLQFGMVLSAIYFRLE